MNQLINFKGRVVATFDGEVVDRATGEVKNYTPSITVINEETYEQIKLKVSPDEQKKYGNKIGAIFQFRGFYTKIAQPSPPSEMMCVGVEEMKKN